MDKQLIKLIDLIAVILSFLSLIFASVLCLLLWRVRRKRDKQSLRKRSQVLLTTHVYYMALCDVLLSLWSILTYTPAVFDDSFSSFMDSSNGKSISFDSIGDNLWCFFMALLGQFASIGSACWYIMISYCLWRILFGHNPLSISQKKKKIKSPNTNLTNNISRNLKFRKRSSPNTKEYPQQYKILPVKEDESMHQFGKVKTSSNATMSLKNESNPVLVEDEDDVISPNKFLNLPRSSSVYSNENKVKSKSVGHDVNHAYHNSTSSLWSSWSVDTDKKDRMVTTPRGTPIGEDTLAFNAQIQS